MERASTASRSGRERPRKEEEEQEEQEEKSPPTMPPTMAPIRGARAGLAGSAPAPSRRKFRKVCFFPPFSDGITVTLFVK